MNGYEVYIVGLIIYTSNNCDKKKPLISGFFNKYYFSIVNSQRLFKACSSSPQTSSVIH
jgi:hypothetical protein